MKLNTIKFYKMYKYVRTFCAKCFSGITCIPFIIFH